VDTDAIGFCSDVNGIKKPINFDAIDGWAVYIPSVDTVCYFSKNMVKDGNKGYRIRKIPGSKSINVDKSPVILYSDITDENVFWEGG
jgi:hypothetical protein